MENSNFSEQETVQSVKFTQNQQAYFAEIRQKQDKQKIWHFIFWQNLVHPTDFWRIISTVPVQE